MSAGMKIMRQKTLCWLTACLLTSAVGCSSFNGDWKAAADQAPPADDITGRWEGTWTSDTNAHAGGLRCLITKGDEGAYQARFHATYTLLFIPCTFELTIPIQIDEDKAGWKHFAGEADLGWPWGAFSHKGSASAEKFKSAYMSDADQGVFEMSRPGAESEEEAAKSASE